MNKIPLHIFWLILSVTGLQRALAQDAVLVKASVDRSEILIGEPIQLVLEAQLPAGYDSAWFMLDSLAHFEFIEKGKIDSALTGEGKTLRQHLLITSFDSGRWVIPPIPIFLNKKKYVTDSIPVSVAFSKFDPKQDYHDIKDILEVENPYTQYVLWAIGAISLISILLFLYFVTRRKPFKQEEPGKIISTESAFEEAIRSLDALRKQGLAENGQIKLFYSELNDIFRRFVWRKLQMASMDRTNEELIIGLKQMKIPDEVFSGLTQTLRMSDFVKFAKYQPGSSDNRENFEIIRSSIEFINTMDN